MGTRSNIAIQNEDGTVDMVYCHWDGYPENNGVILQNHYTTEDAVRELLSFGDMSSLGTEVGEQHDFDSSPDGWTTFYGRDRGETGVGLSTYANLEEAQSDMEEYLYVFGTDGTWQFSDHGSNFRSLEKAVNKIVREGKAIKSAL